MSQFKRKGWLDLTFLQSVVQWSLASGVVGEAILVLINRRKAKLERSDP